MRHDQRFFTFQDAYLNQIAKFHLQNGFLEEEMENQMFRLFAHVSLTRDPRARRDMVPPDVWANLAPDPEITELEERRAELKQGPVSLRRSGERGRDPRADGCDPLKTGTARETDREGVPSELLPSPPHLGS